MLSQLHNQGTAVLIANVERGRSILYSLLLALLLSVVDLQPAHFDCDDRLGLVVDDSGINCCSTPLHGLQNLAHLNKLVRHPNLGLVREYHSGGIPL